MTYLDKAQTELDEISERLCRSDLSSTERRQLWSRAIALDAAILRGEESCRALYEREAQ